MRELAFQMLQASNSLRVLDFFRAPLSLPGKEVLSTWELRLVLVSSVAAQQLALEVGLAPPAP